MSIRTELVIVCCMLWQKWPAQHGELGFTVKEIRRSIIFLMLLTIAGIEDVACLPQTSTFSTSKAWTKEL